MNFRDTALATSRRYIAAENEPQQDLSAAFSIFNGKIVTRRDLYRHAINAGRYLPDGAYALNLCRDRYVFSVAFIAAALKRQQVLLPANQTLYAARQLLENYPGSYVITDRPIEGLEKTWLLSARHFDGEAGDIPSIPAAQTVCIAFTSGSTGQPKAIAKSWGEFRQAARLALQQLQLGGRDWRIVATVPPQHMYGLETSLFWPLYSTLTIDSRQPFFPEDIRQTLYPGAAKPTLAGVRSRPCLLVSTPTHLKACIGAGLAWRNVGAVLSSTGPLAFELARTVEQRMQAPLLEIFGSTETQSYASRRLTVSPKWKPYAGVRLLEGSQGFRVLGGHLRHGVALDDRFEIDAEGDFTLLGRSAELIKVAGKRVALAELNTKLTSIDGVEDGAFFQGQDDRLGALVVGELSKQRILSALKPLLDPVFLPRSLYHVERLPRNELGKLNHQQLLQLIDACKQRCL